MDRQKAIEWFRKYGVHTRYCKTNFFIASAKGNTFYEECDCGRDQALAALSSEVCKTCGGVKVVSSGESCWYNCEMGGEDCAGMTKGVLDNPDACKTCGKTVPCPKCMPVANEYYNLWTRDSRELRLKLRALEKKLSKKSEPVEPSEFTRKIRELYPKGADGKSYGSIHDAADTIDRQAATIKSQAEEIKNLKKASHAIQCPDDDCCGTLFEGEIIGDIQCNECGGKYEATLVDLPPFRRVKDK